MSFHHHPEFHRIIMQDKKLRVPMKYVEKYWKGISNPIFLRFPNGKEQKIFWVEKNGDIFFEKNWEDFAKCLKYGNLLTFKYIGGSHFKVKIFGFNTLEIDYSNLKSIEDKEEVGEDAAKEFIEVSEEDECEDESDEDETEDEFEIVKQPQRKTNSKRKIHVDMASMSEEVECDDETDEDETEDEFEIVKQPQRKTNRKRKIPVDLASSSSIGGMAKKVKKCSTEIDGNPFFEVKLKSCYATGHFLMVPSMFSREHLNNFVGTALLQVGRKAPMKVNMKFDDKNRRSTISRGWMSFRERYELKTGDSCKFVMIQRWPLVFNVIIGRVMKGPSPRMLRGLRKVGGNLWMNGK